MQKYTHKYINMNMRNVSSTDQEAFYQLNSFTAKIKTYCSINNTLMRCLVADCTEVKRRQSYRCSAAMHSGTQASNCNKLVSIERYYSKTMFCAIKSIY